jgi:hypothetical protein
VTVFSWTVQATFEHAFCGHLIAPDFYVVSVIDRRKREEAAEERKSRSWRSKTTMVDVARITSLARHETHVKASRTPNDEAGERRQIGGISIRAGHNCECVRSKALDERVALNADKSTEEDRERERERKTRSSEEWQSEQFERIIWKGSHKYQVNVSRATSLAHTKQAEDAQQPHEGGPKLFGVFNDARDSYSQEQKQQSTDSVGSTLKMIEANASNTSKRWDLTVQKRQVNRIKSIGIRD